MQATKIRARTNDVAYQFRMGSGFPGDVNRTHPASIEPVINSTSSPMTAFGQAVLLDSSGFARPFTTGDQSNTVPAGYGVSVRPYPFQQSSASNFGQADFGSATPPAGVLDVLREGYIIVKIPASETPKKGDPVYVWATASAGSQVQGGFTSVYSAGNTTQFRKATFTASPDAQGYVEISIASSNP